MRYAATALLCVIVAFGAAFLVRRAVDHGTSARGTVAADTRHSPATPTPASTGRREDTAAVHHRAHGPGLASEFAPGVQRITRKHPKPKHKPHHQVVAHSSGSSSSGSTYTPTSTTYTQPYTPPATTTPSTGSSGSGGTTSGSSSGGRRSGGSGTGTTSIGGGSGKGSGTTTIG